MKVIEESQIGSHKMHGRIRKEYGTIHQKNAAAVRPCRCAMTHMGSPSHQRASWLAMENCSLVLSAGRK